MIGRLLPIILSLVVAPASAQRVYTTTRLTSEPPRIDGQLNDPAWEEGGWAGDFTQQLPRAGDPPSQPTAFKILFDDSYLYVAIRAFDSEPQKIERRIAPRDELSGDVVGVAFDSYHDRRTAYEFNLTAAGAKIDLMHKPPKVWDFTWDAVWDGATALEDSAWTAEMRIPFSQLRFSPGDEQVWGLHLWRWIHRLEEESQFQLIAPDAAFMVPNFGELRGISGLASRPRVSVLPYVTARGSTFQPVDGNPFADGTRGTAGAGLDAKIGLSSAFTMDLTLNPDFGQVEADPSTINLTAFETFYEEKRPFFLEGSSLFSYEFEGEEIFYSRRIGTAPRHSLRLSEDEFARSPEATTILGAAKVSGKTSKGLSVGILASLTAHEFADVSASGRRFREAVEPLTSYLVTRLEQEYNEGRTVLTGMFTSVLRRLDDAQLRFLAREAYSGGVGFSHFVPDRTYYIRLNLVGSHVAGDTTAIAALQRSSMHYFQRPDVDHLAFDPNRTRLGGTGGSVEIGRAGTGRWRFSEEFSWQSPGLDFSEAGFMRTPSDRLNLESVLQYVVTEETPYFRSYSVDVEHGSEWDFGGNMMLLVGALALEGQLRSYWRLGGSATRGQESLDRHLLRGGPAYLTPGWWHFDAFVRSDGRRDVSFRLAGCRGWSDGWDTNHYSFSPSLDWRVSPAFSLEGSLGFQAGQNDLQYVATHDAGDVALPASADYFLGRINQKTVSFTLRANYSLRPDLVVQLYAQPFIASGRYEDFKRVTDPRADTYDDRFAAADGTDLGNPDFTLREFRSNVVLRWEYRPGSNLYLVWSQMRTGRDAAGDFHLRRDLSRLYDIYPHNVFAVKLSYWLGTH